MKTNWFDPANMVKVNDKNTKTMCETCSELTMSELEWRYWYCSGDFIVNFQPVLHLFLVLLLFSFNMQMSTSWGFTSSRCSCNIGTRKLISSANIIRKLFASKFLTLPPGHRTQIERKEDVPETYDAP